MSMARSIIPSGALARSRARRRSSRRSARARLPIFVGGTGLYFKALTQGLSDMPRVPEEVRAEVRARAPSVAGRRASRRTRAPRSRDGGAAAPERSAAHSARARGPGGDRAKASPSSRARAWQPLLDIAAARAIFLAPERDGAEARASTRASTRCWRAARWMKPRRCASAGSIRRCRSCARMACRIYRPSRGRDRISPRRRNSPSATRAPMRKRQFTFARHQLPGFRLGRRG